ncbi:hypothetical protein CBD41_03340 [bacterium TMED181]|nr:hypothetical protein [Planctomycetota bacterium]OUW45851.1 MAG: hypothetical protein CBD41_03340 [bacterium TMED181]
MPKPKRNNPAKGKTRSRAAESIHRRLQGLVKSLLDRDGSEAISGLPDVVELNLHVPVQLKTDDPHLSQKFAQNLVQQIEALRTEGEIEVHGHRSGHVHCYWCQQPDCEHSVPIDGHTVLSGWSATGLPLWKNLTNHLLAEAPELLDHIHGDTISPLALLVDGTDLLAEVLPQYLEGTTFAHPLAGLIVGGFPLQLPNHEMDHLALTALILETRTAKGTPKYRWNFIATPPKPFHLATLLGQEDTSPLARWISVLRTMLVGVQEEIEHRAREGKRMPMKECRQKVFKMLSEAQSILGTFNRRQDRKTQHAQERSNDPNRPTSAAIADVLASKRKDVFFDQRESTVIVRGPSGRVHVFTQNGIHVTSARYSPDSILLRIQRKRWVSMEDSDYLRFHEEIHQRLDQNRDEADGRNLGNA